MVDNTTEQRWQPSNDIITASVNSPLLPDNKPVHQVSTTPKTTAQATYKPNKRLTGKQREFIRLFIEHPKTPLYEIAEQAGYTGDNATLRSIGSENLTKPNILQELAKHSDYAENALIEVLQQSKKRMYDDSARAVDWAVNTRQTADSVLDRIHGKATQKTEVTTRALTLNIDLTGAVGASE